MGDEFLKLIERINKKRQELEDIKTEIKNKRSEIAELDSIIAQKHKKIEDLEREETDIKERIQKLKETWLEYLEMAEDIIMLKGFVEQQTLSEGETELKK